MFLSKVNSKLLKHLMVGCSALVLSLLVTYFFAKVEHDSVSSRRAGGMKLREVSQRYVEQIEVCAEKKTHGELCSGGEFSRDNFIIFQNSGHEVVAIDFQLKIVLIQKKNQDLWKCYVPKNSYSIVGCEFLE